MNLKVIVEDVSVFEETTSKGTVLHKQQVKLVGQGGPAVYFQIDAKDGKPYSQGEYELSVRSFRPGRFGGLEVDPYRVTLVPLSSTSSIVNKPRAAVG